MCEDSGKLIAWLDRELPAEEAADVERHLERCSECRERVETFRRVSGELDAYCGELLATKSKASAKPWLAAIAAAGAAASLITLFLIWPRPRVQAPAFPFSQASIAAPPVARGNAISTPERPNQKIHRTRTAKPVQVSEEANSAKWNGPSPSLVTGEPVVQIAIPAEEIFPPGAVPEGMRFFADLTVAPDGSAERLRLRPRLAGFERSTTQP